MFNSRFNRSSASIAVAALAAVSLGLGATAANAANVPITGEHNDILKINSSNVIGTESAQLSPIFKSWADMTADSDHYVYTFDLDLTDTEFCSDGIISVPAFPEPGQGPSVGFDNQSGSDYEVELISSVPVSFNGGSAFNIDSGNTETLPNGVHVHGSWAINAGSCAGGGSFDLEFNVEEAEPGANVGNRSFTFEVNQA